MGWERLGCVSWLRTWIQFWASGIGDVGKTRNDEGAWIVGRSGPSTTMNRRDSPPLRGRKAVSGFCGAKHGKDSGEGNQHQCGLLVRRVEG